MEITEVKVFPAKEMGSRLKAYATVVFDNCFIIRDLKVIEGAKGAFVLDKDSSGMVEGFEAETVDTTAAGDVFNGALAVGLAKGMQLKKAVTFANAAGALSVTKLGAQPSAPYLSDIQRLYESREEKTLEVNRGEK